MLTKNDLIITEFLLNNLNEKFSIRGISRNIKIDYKLVHNSITRLTNKNVIDKKRYGNTDLCSLNLSSIEYLVQVETYKSNNFLIKNPNIRLIINDIKAALKNPYYTLLIFGSYAKGNQRETSDIDIMLIIPNQNNKNEIKTAVNTATRIRPVNIHSLILTSQEFIEMIDSKQELNVAKEALNNHVVFHGAEAFYRLLR